MNYKVDHDLDLKISVLSGISCYKICYNEFDALTEPNK